MRSTSLKVRPRRTAFTLVEMLTVITIIGILAAILIPTAGTVIRSTKLNAIAIEVNSLSQAIEDYKSDHNDYPPDFSNVRAVDIHVRRAFPRNNFQFAAWVAGRMDKTQMPDFNGNGLAGPDPATLDPAEAMVYWLTLLKSNQRNPFADPVGQPTQREVRFEFDTTLLTDVDDDGWMEYGSTHAGGTPYVYFDGRIQNDEVFNNGRCVATGNPAVCAYAWAVYPPLPERLACVGRNVPVLTLPTNTFTPFGVVRPYRDFDPGSGDGYATFERTDTSTFPKEPLVTNGGPQVNSTPWKEAGKFQIIAPGLDNSFGNDYTSGDQVIFKTFPSPNYLPSDDAFEGGRDDITNFSDNKTIEAGIP